MQNLPNKIKLLNNFSCCSSWEEKYLYIIQLGKLLPKFPINKKNNKYLISGCQSKVWVYIDVQSNKKIKFYSDSDSSIIKGLIAIILIIYKDMNISEILSYDIKNFFNSLSLYQYITYSRSIGLNFTIKTIHKYLNKFL